MVFRFQGGISSVTIHSYCLNRPQVAFYRTSGAEAAFPRFTGEVSRPGGRYAAHRFSFDDCRARHADIVAELAMLYNLHSEQP